MLVYHYIPSTDIVMQDIFEISSIAWRCSNQFYLNPLNKRDIKNYKIFYPVTNDLREAIHGSETHFFDLIKKCQITGNNLKKFIIILGLWKKW